MSLIKEKSCAACGKKTNPFSRTKLCDKRVLCTQCVRTVPYFMRKSLKEHYGSQDFENLRQYIEYSKTKLRPIFTTTDSYYNIYLDRNNGLFCFGEANSDKTLIFELGNVKMFDLGFKAEGSRDGFSGIYVYGKMIMGLEMETPYFYHECIVANGIRTSAKKIMYGSKVSYSNPKGMDEFLELFIEACNESQLRTAYKEEISQYTPFTIETSSELQQAMALFMIDCPEDLTFERIRTQRNRLIKAFHPDRGSDTDTAYAQKINNAYETLFKLIR